MSSADGFEPGFADQSEVVFADRVALGRDVDGRAGDGLVHAGEPSERIVRQRVEHRGEAIGGGRPAVLPTTQKNDGHVEAAAVGDARQRQRNAHRHADRGARAEEAAEPARPFVFERAGCEGAERRVAKERRLTISRALVTLAERGVRAEQDARENLNGAYREFLKERKPSKKEDAGKQLTQAIFGKDAITEDQIL